MPRKLLHAVAGMVSSIGGCAGDDAGIQPTPSGDVLLRAAASAALVQDGGPTAPFVAEVRAWGTGCPSGSSETSVSKDGSTLVTRFSAYEVEIGERERLATSDCTLTVMLRGPTPLSYAISAFTYEGYAFIDEGVRGSHSSRAYFLGSEVTARNYDTALAGPFDRAYRYVAAEREEDLIWSPCGKERELRIANRIMVRKQQGRGVGYMNLAALGVDGHIGVTLEARACTPSALGDEHAMQDAGSSSP